MALSLKETNISYTIQSCFLALSVLFRNKISKTCININSSYATSDKQTGIVF